MQPTGEQRRKQPADLHTGSHCGEYRLYSSLTFGSAEHIAETVVWAPKSGHPVAFESFECEFLFFFEPFSWQITDANDHSPVFQNAPYSANVSESTPLYSQIIPAGIIRAVDNDQEGPFSTVQYNVLPGPFSHMVRFESPLGGALLLASPLDFETQPQFFVEISCADQGQPPRQSVTKVTIYVKDADDQNPRFLDEKYSAVWEDTLRIGDQMLVHPRPIKGKYEVASPVKHSTH